MSARNEAKRKDSTRNGQEGRKKAFVASQEGIYYLLMIRIERDYEGKRKETEFSVSKRRGIHTNTEIERRDFRRLGRIDKEQGKVYLFHDQSHRVKCKNIIL